MSTIERREDWLPGWELTREDPFYLAYDKFLGHCGGMVRLGLELFALGVLPDFKSADSAKVMENPDVGRYHCDGTSGNFAERCSFFTEPGWFIVTARGSHKGRLWTRSFVLAKVVWEQNVVRMRELRVLEESAPEFPDLRELCIKGARKRNWLEKISLLLTEELPFKDGSTRAPLQPSTDSLLVAAAFESNSRLEAWSHPHSPSGLSRGKRHEELRLRYPSTDASDFDVLRTAVENGARVIDLIDHDPRKTPNGKVDSMIVLASSFRRAGEITLGFIRRAIRAERAAR